MPFVMPLLRERLFPVSVYAPAEALKLMLQNAVPAVISLMLVSLVAALVKTRAHPAVGAVTLPQFCLVLQFAPDPEPPSQDAVPAWPYKLLVATAEITKAARSRETGKFRIKLFECMFWVRAAGWNWTKGADL